METTVTLEQLCLRHQIDAAEIARRTGLEEQRVAAIILGRWTPTPQERDKVAQVFGLTREQISWGHKTPIQHIYGHGPA